MKTTSLKTATMDEIAREICRRAEARTCPHCIFAWIARPGESPEIARALNYTTAMTMLGSLTADLTKFIAEGIKP